MAASFLFRIAAAVAGGAWRTFPGLGGIGRVFPAGLGGIGRVFSAGFRGIGRVFSGEKLRGETGAGGTGEGSVLPIVGSWFVVSFTGSSTGAALPHTSCCIP